MILQTSGLTKIYRGNVIGIQDLSLEIGKGVFGLLGPNGAGKTTLMRILATVMKPTSGRASFDGHDIYAQPKDIRQVLGYLPQDFGVYPMLTAFEFLYYLASLKGIKDTQREHRVREVLELVDLVEVANRKLGTYSGGMKQRVGIAQALLNDPKLLIIDEPTAGLDPAERIKFRNLLNNLGEDRIVMISTHIVFDIEVAATDLALIKSGKLLVHTSPVELLNELRGKVWALTTDDAGCQKLQAQYIISSTTRHTEGIELRVIAEDNPGYNATSLEPNLEDAYLYYTSD